MNEITDVRAFEVLDSRGNPTVRTVVEVGNVFGRFTVPAGASTGSHEAVERRDGDDRYDGFGVSAAVSAIETELKPLVVGRSVGDRHEIDRTLVEHDGTAGLERIGANAVLGVSGAVAHAASRVEDIPLFEYFARETGMSATLPTPMINMISGGLHAIGGIELQDILVIPRSASTYSEAIETCWDVRSAIRERIIDQGHRPLVADEGGFAPPIDDIETAFEYVLTAIESAGYLPGRDIEFAIDVAASHFYDEGTSSYRLDSLNRSLETGEMIDLVCEWVDTYPIRSIEDPLTESDWEGWEKLHRRLPEGTQLLGDDLLVTDRGRLETAHERSAANAVLVKPNQAGTLSRTIDVIEAAKRLDFATVVSARSGETVDTTIADLAVGSNAGQIKIGSLARSERLAKYNRLFELEASFDIEYVDPFDSV